MVPASWKLRTRAVLAMAAVALCATAALPAAAEAATGCSAEAVRPVHGERRAWFMDWLAAYAKDAGSWVSAASTRVNLRMSRYDSFLTASSRSSWGLTPFYRDPSDPTSDLTSPTPMASQRSPKAKALPGSRRPSSAP